MPSSWMFSWTLSCLTYCKASQNRKIRKAKRFAIVMNSSYESGQLNIKTAIFSFLFLRAPKDMSSHIFKIGQVIKCPSHGCFPEPHCVLCIIKHYRIEPYKDSFFCDCQGFFEWIRQSNIKTATISLLFLRARKKINGSYIP